MSNAEKAERILSKPQLEFIQSEFGYDPDSLGIMDDEMFSRLYDRIGDIEVEETIAAGDGNLSERGKMAEGIVTILGNELYRPEGESEDLDLDDE